MCILKWLFLNTYKGVPYCRVTVLARVLHACIFCENSIFDLKLTQRTRQDLISDLRAGPKAAMLTIELHCNTILIIYTPSTLYPLEIVCHLIVTKKGSSKLISHSSYTDHSVLENGMLINKKIHIIV